MTPSASVAWSQSTWRARSAPSSSSRTLLSIVWTGAHPEAELHAPLPNAVLQAALNEVIGELLIAREAVRVRAEAPSSGEVEECVRRVDADDLKVLPADFKQIR